MTDLAANSADPMLPGSASGFRGWHMVARGFICQNVAIGSLFGTFGITMLAVQDRFETNRMTVSLGLSSALLTMSLVSAFLATMIDRFTLRWTMMLGIALASAGYVLLASAPTPSLFLLAYALLIGPGVGMSGPLAASLLASNWFVKQQGKAIGIANIPLFTAMAPLVGTLVLSRYGLTGLYLCMAACHLLLLPAVLTLVERPELVGQQAFGSEFAHRASNGSPGTAALTRRQLLARKSFWVVAIGGGALKASGIVIAAHLVAIAVEGGSSPVQGSLLISISGAMGIVGALLIGMLCDRMGAARALALAGAGVCVGWALMLVTTWLPALLFSTTLFGICAGGIFPAINLLARNLFGPASMPRAVGLLVLMTLPFMFGFPPLAGYTHDVTGTYHSVIVLMTASCGIVAAAMIGLSFVERQRLVTIDATDKVAQAPDISAPAQVQSAMTAEMKFHFRQEAQPAQPG